MEKPRPYDRYDYYAFCARHSLTPGGEDSVRFAEGIWKKVYEQRRSQPWYWKLLRCIRNALNGDGCI